MLDGIFRNPTEIIFGKSALDNLGAKARQTGNRALVVHGEKSYTNSGLDERIRAQLQQSEVKFVDLVSVQPNPRADLVYRGLELAHKHDIDFILAVGGGSVIDTAKAIGIGMHYDGDFFDLFLGKAIPTRMTSVGVVLTIFGSGSESSDGAVIDKKGRKYPCGGSMMYPCFAILDPIITESVPALLLASGIYDSICHILERYFTPTPYVETSDELCFALLKVLVGLGPQLLRDPENYEIRANVMWASKLAHDGTVGFGRKHDWATHTIAHEIGARTNKPHGAVLAVLFPAWMKFMKDQKPGTLGKLGTGVFSSQKAYTLNAQDTICRMEELVISLGLPTRLNELGIDNDKIFSSIAECCSQTTKSGTIGNLKRLNKDDIVKILELAAAK